MAAPPEATESERLARLEAAVERLVREVSDVKADGRDLRAVMRDLRAEIRNLRSVMRRNFLITIGVMVATWLVTISLLLVALFRM